jgi:hypothetical protein
MGAPAIRVASHEPSITPTFPRKGQFLFSGRFFLPLSAHESRRLLAFPFIPLAEYRSGLRSPFPARPTRCSTFRSGSASRALPTAGSTVRFADFCDTVKVNRFTLSHESVTCHRSPEVSSTAFDAQPPDLQPVGLMDMGFAVPCPLARHRMPQIQFLYISSHLCSALLSGPASRRVLFHPCASLSLHVHHVVKRTYTS